MLGTQGLSQVTHHMTGDSPLVLWCTAAPAGSISLAVPLCVLIAATLEIAKCDLVDLTNSGTIVGFVMLLFPIHDHAKHDQSKALRLTALWVSSQSSEEGHQIQVSSW